MLFTDQDNLIFNNLLELYEESRYSWLSLKSFVLFLLFSPFFSTSRDDERTSNFS